MAASPRPAPGALRVFLSRSPEATEALGATLGAGLVAGAVVALSGELGSGKTTLVRGLARGLGVAGPVTSPSFTLMHEHPGPLALYHFDAWMAGREALFLEGGGAEYLGGEGVAVVEWAERIEAWLPAPRLAVRLDHRGPAERSIELAVVPSAAGEEPRAKALEELLDGLLEAIAAGPDLVPVSAAGRAGTPGA